MDPTGSVKRIRCEAAMAHKTVTVDRAQVILKNSQAKKVVEAPILASQLREIVGSDNMRLVATIRLLIALESGAFQ